MPSQSLPPKADPLAAFLHTAGPGWGSHPIPLVSTAMEVEIDGGVVIVSTTRVFRNVEAESIEATMTFPVPVHATLFALEARIDDRYLRAQAQTKLEARKTYEQAIDDGKAAVLHEEVLRGVHMLSVAPLAPGAEIEVTARWVATLTYVGSRGEIRIPLTVGAIYGASPLSDSDDLLTEGEAGAADLVVRCADGLVELLGTKLEDGRCRVPLNAPVDLIVPRPATKELHGLAADGRQVVLRVAPYTADEGTLDLAILVDHSGSMGDPAGGIFGRTSKHEAVVAALAAVAPHLRAGDAVDLWEFDTRLGHVGAVKESGSDASGSTYLRDLFRAFVGLLSEPSGGTEIGQAIAGTFRGSAAKDLLLITDGKSYALDIQALAAEGRRISALLVGEDSLEANVGHLASLTGGDLFVALDADMADTLATALTTLRAPSQPAVETEPGRQLRAVRRNALVEVEWRLADPSVQADGKARAVAALAAGLRLATLPEAKAAALAEAEGLVTHLTSLILVDEAGEVQEGIPATRKIALPEPRSAAITRVDHLVMFEERASVSPSSDARLRQIEAKARRKLKRPTRSRKLMSFLDPAIERSGDFYSGSSRAPAETSAPLGGWARVLEASRGIDWETAPNRLVLGDLSAFGAPIAKDVLRWTVSPAVRVFAQREGMDPLLVVIGLLARHNAANSRAAARVATAILGSAGPEQVRALSEQLGGSM